MAFLICLQIILTHEHADAVLGLDDIRAVQPYSPTNDIEPTPIYLTQFAMDRYLQLYLVKTYRDWNGLSSTPSLVSRHGKL